MANTDDLSGLLAGNIALEETILSQTTEFKKEKKL